MAIARLASTLLDWSGPAAIVDFWAALLGGEVHLGNDEACAVRTGNRWIAAVSVGDHRPPTWPAADAPKQIRLDQDRSGPAEAEASGPGSDGGRPAGSGSLAGVLRSCGPSLLLRCADSRVTGSIGRRAKRAHVRRCASSLQVAVPHSVPDELSKGGRSWGAAVPGPTGWVGWAGVR